MSDLIKLAADERNIEPTIKQNNLKSLTIHLQNALRFHKRMLRRMMIPHKTFRVLNLPFSAFYMSIIYLATKTFYLINVALQLMFLNKFLETDNYTLYGFGAFLDILNGTTWEQSNLFPRVTFCDFKVRAMGNVQDHSIQCVLVINMFNEKIFVFLWFWLMILFVLTLLSLLYWFFVLAFPWPSRWFIVQQLELSEMTFDPVASCKDVERFVGGYLKSDGVFVLRMISNRAGVIFGTELVTSLWKNFYNLEQTAPRKTENTPLIKGKKALTNTAIGSGGKLNLRQRIRKVKTDNPQSTSRVTPPPSPTPSSKASTDKLLRKLSAGSGNSSGQHTPPAPVKQVVSDNARPAVPPRPDKVSAHSY